MMPLIGLSTAFNKLLEKATSNLKLEPDWPTILSICDLIRQGDVTPKNALAAINKKITHDNPHTAGFGLLVLESCVKNCGTLIHDEVCTKQYMEQLKEIAKTTQEEFVRNKILELIQAWAYAFRDSQKYRAVQDTMRIMKAENFEFPVLQESDAMFTADIAPEWVDGDKCHRCRTAFYAFNRKHHCRACGQVFCQQCSAKSSTLPKYGIERQVRVCNTCYDQINKPVVTTSKETDLPAEYLTSSLAQQQQVPPRKTDEDLREEEDLQIALALSQSEAEHKEREKKRVTSAIITQSTVYSKVNYSPPPSPSPSPSKIQEEEEVDPELAKYLNRQYWEQRQMALEEQTSRLNVTSPSAPNISSPMPQKVIATKQQNGEVDPEMKNFVDNLRSQVEIFVNRMKSDSSRGRSIANDSSVQTLFMNITALHSKLLRYIQDQEDKRVYFEGLQDKLTQIKDARGAVDALREEHRLALLREKQEADRKKQLQMAEKLEIMRKKKQELLQYQRQLALNRIQEQELEMQMRQEQQKQYNIGGYPTVPGYMGPPSQGSPSRQVQYSSADPNYNAIPTNQGQTVYAYPTNHTASYSMPPGYLMQHPHSTQLIDPSIIQDTKPTLVEGQNNQNQENLGRVTVSGPGIQMPVIPGVESQQTQQPQQPQSQPQAQQQQQRLQHPSNTDRIPVAGQPGNLSGHIPKVGIPGHMPGAQRMLPQHMGQTQPPNNHMMTPSMPPNVMPQGGVQILPNGQLLQRQQIIIGQPPGHHGQVIPQGMPRQMAIPGQIGQPLSIGNNMTIPGQMVMTSSNGQMQTPAQMQRSPSQLQGAPLQMQNLPRLYFAQTMQQQQMQLQQQQTPQQQPLQQQQQPIHQQPQLQQQHPIPEQRQQRLQEAPQHQQIQQPLQIPKEEERKSPETAELISFD